MNWIARCVELYRPKQLDRIIQQPDGSYLPDYKLGPIKARVRFLSIPVPALWAFELTLRIE